MILGIGIDNVDVERIQKKISKNPDFLSYVFSSAEIEICNRKTKKYESFAARFAAKEAFLKAIGTGIDLSIPLNQIVIHNQSDGKPYIEINDTIRMLFTNLFTFTPKVHISMSHSSTEAFAFVIIESD
ncbi:holo-ACP synthase [Cytophagaceae bacterium DM2B3-1]|uniref:Holo-[acyl-carrier-protein] synthase n=1 Tax=Xanthocytophaga flava TaxID=3048013 RepID=A0ABT7CT78_9BACT|nr:holo-ACP synthase [Xanthocytophaga flavus]MDJ1496983.1 holo-ACP synthase [Xanthocytophaga flavus]